tara:strand:+ start:435 stop:629 length:195 start_codon:yes stop_codon:yes gene_type:complete
MEMISDQKRRSANKLAELQSRLSGKPIKRRPLDRGRFEGIGNTWPAHLLTNDQTADDMPTWLFR